MTEGRILLQSVFTQALLERGHAHALRSPSAARKVVRHPLSNLASCPEHILDLASCSEREEKELFA